MASKRRSFISLIFIINLNMVKLLTRPSNLFKGYRGKILKVGQIANKIIPNNQ